jgi:hypothetical protein
MQILTLKATSIISKVDLIVRIHLKQEWLNTLDKHPMIKKHLRGFIANCINLALIDRGKVVEIRIEETEKSN